MFELFYGFAETYLAIISFGDWAILRTTLHLSSWPSSGSGLMVMRKTQNKVTLVAYMFALTRTTLILQPCWQLCKAEGLIVKRSCFTDKPKCWTDWHFSVWGQQDHKDHECQHQIAVCICISLWTINVSCWWWQRKSRGNTKVRSLYSMETIQVKYHQSVLLDWLNIFSIWVSTCSALGCQTGYKHEFY